MDSITSPRACASTTSNFQPAHTFDNPFSTGAVLSRAGGQCECEGVCGTEHQDGCNNPPTSAAPTDPAQTAARHPLDLSAWCSHCLTSARNGETVPTTIDLRDSVESPTARYALRTPKDADMERHLSIGAGWHMAEYDEDREARKFAGLHRLDLHPVTRGRPDVRKPGTVIQGRARFRWLRKSPASPELAVSAARAERSR